MAEEREPEQIRRDKKQIRWVDSEDPTFEGGITKTAVATMSNPTAKAFNYTAELYLDVTKVASSGVIAFTLAPGTQQPVSFPLTMPLVEGDFPVYLDVLVGGVVVGAFQATENVVIVISPEIVIGPITWN
ncbi:hypothetical protein LCGC14_1643600 [marine sediment metagenome]|uniref:CARDB domain-containing protein n=1 Tax=marine sediment metagenome TaxID=412755 RepID=A0A0F9HYU7_9ZZZZ